MNNKPLNQTYQTNSAKAVKEIDNPVFVFNFWPTFFGKKCIASCKDGSKFRWSNQVWRPTDGV